MDDHRALLAVLSVRRVIRQEPFRIGFLLTFAAGRLPLEELGRTMEKVIGAISADTAAVLELRNAMDSLRDIQQLLRGRVAEHNQWQELEREFLEIDDWIESGEPDAIEALRDLWSSIKSRYESLARAEPESDWAKASRSAAELIERDIASHQGALARSALAERLSYMRNDASFQFYRIHHALMSQCEQILKISAPLQSILDRV